MSEWMVGVDLGGTKIALGLVNPQDQIIARRNPLRRCDYARFESGTSLRFALKRSGGMHSAVAAD